MKKLLMDKRFFVSYPAIKHPLANEKTELKMKYLCLIEYFRMQICPEDVIVQARVERFKKDFLAPIMRLRIYNFSMAVIGQFSKHLPQCRQCSFMIS